MKISTRSRYGTRLMLVLALEYGRGAVFLKEIAKREEISEKYLSQIIIPLRGSGLVNSFRGAHGGYSLAKPPSEITLREIVDILEGGFNLVPQAKTAASRQMVSQRVTGEVWEKLREAIFQTLGSITLEDLISRYSEKNGKAAFMYNI